MSARRALLLALPLLLGCPPPAPPSPPPAPPAPAATWSALDGAALEPARVAQRERAEAARAALGGGLKQALGAALQAGGPPAAIEVCNERAPALAGEVAAAQGLRIGRTSHRLRNPANQPPAWAAAHVAAARPEPAFAAGPGGELGVLLPILTEPTCLLCHGDPAGFSPELRQALAGRYPEDQATGFAEGELRGWFWVEVPAGP